LCAARVEEAVPDQTSVRSSHSPAPDYDRPPEHATLLQERDVAVPMRDGVKLSVDVYRPDAPGKFPALLAFAIYNKDLQGPDTSDALPPQPAWSTLWTGPMEAGDTRYFVSRGYAHVIGTPRGIG
jgi:predicted acyl esterase